MPSCIFSGGCQEPNWGNILTLLHSTPLQTFWVEGVAPLKFETGVARVLDTGGNSLLMFKNICLFFREIVKCVGLAWRDCSGNN